MNEISQRQLLCLAMVDGDLDEDGESLSANAKLVDPDAWAELLEAAKLREDDDLTCYGYIFKAWATDPVSGALIHHEVWTDLCQDQVGRMYG